MAALFPNNPVGLLSAEATRVFGVLKRLPERYIIWQYLTPAVPGATFLVRRDDGRMLVIAVAGATAADVRGALQSGLFETRALPGAAETAALTALTAQLAGAIGVERLPGGVVFPLVASGELAQALPAPPDGVVIAGREILTSSSFAGWVESHLSPPLDLDALDRLRRVFTPEVVIPGDLTVRALRERGTAAELTDYVLSYNQEWILKYDLELPEEEAGTSDDLRLRLVHGVAGSGKSLILLYRARLLRQYFPQKRILVLTHNRPLIRDLEQRYLRLSEGDRGVEWRTFHSWCHRYWPEDEPRLLLVRAAERRDLVRRVWHQHLAETSLSPEVLQDEIDWVKDRLITTRQGYLAADRSGRGFGLSEPMRERVYSAILAYHDTLRERGLADYGDVPRRLWRALFEGRAAFPIYDFILVDEAQFFAPIWFEILKQVVNPRTGQLFLVADPTQGFLKRRQSWLASGLSVRGRTHRLERCYRTTPAILGFASRYYQHCLPGDDEALIAPASVQFGEGEPPQLVSLTSEQDELARVVNEVRGLLAAGVPPEHILVIHADWQGASRLLDRLRAMCGAARVIHPRQAGNGRQIRVCQLDSATGLESPIVFLVGTHRLIDAEQSVRLSEEERAERVRDTTRRLYMAMTRAGQRLVMTYVGTPPPALG